jgi:hypothetical protein
MTRNFETKAQEVASQPQGATPFWQYWDAALDAAKNADDYWKYIIKNCERIKDAVSTADQEKWLEKIEKAKYHRTKCTAWKLWCTAGKGVLLRRLKQKY